MGDTFGDGEWHERPIHEVCVDDFYLGKYEVVNKEFAAFLNAHGSNQTKEGYKIIDLQGEWKGEKCRIYLKGDRFLVEKDYESYPVLYATWYGAKEYAGFYGKRLPTEAEWEYAAREKGGNFKYAWGNGEPSKAGGANIADNSVLRKVENWKVRNWKPWPGYDDDFPFTAPVGSFKPNRLGLYDMTGNVWEWCEDYFHARFYEKSPVKNPLPAHGETRVVRGGSWLGSPFTLRLTMRGRHYPDNSHCSWGFRVAGETRME